MSMRTMVTWGWLMIVLGVGMLIGGFIVGGAAIAGLALGGLGVAGGGAFMVWMGAGWDKPLENSDELYKYGRPANAEVLAVGEAQTDASGVRTAALKLHVKPKNESTYKTERTVALPAGLQPAVGDTVTIKFDPQSKKNFVLMEENFEVKDQITAASETWFGGASAS